MDSAGEEKTYRRFTDGNKGIIEMEVANELGYTTTVSKDVTEMKNGGNQWALGGAKKLVGKSRRWAPQVRIRPPPNCPHQHCPRQNQGAHIAEPQRVSQLALDDPLQVSSFEGGRLVELANNSISRPCEKSSRRKGAKNKSG